MKKAAVGGGAAAAVWAAPKVEGLKLVPDYAAAATVETCTTEFTSGCLDTIPGTVELGCGSNTVTLFGTPACGFFSGIIWELDDGCSIVSIRCGEDEATWFAFDPFVPNYGYMCCDCEGGEEVTITFEITCIS